MFPPLTVKIKNNFSNFLKSVIIKTFWLKFLGDFVQKHYWGISQRQAVQSKTRDIQAALKGSPSNQLLNTLNGW